MDETHDDLSLGTTEGEEAQAGEPAASQSQVEDPLAGVKAEPIDVSEGPEEERLGGDGAQVGEAIAEPAPGEFLEEPEESEVEVSAGGEDAEEEEAKAETEKEGSEGPPAEAEAEPKTAPARKPKTKQKAKAGGSKTPQRDYKVLRVEEDGSISSPLEKPIASRNGDDAIRGAFKALASAGEEMVLVAIPMGYWKPKPVKGREKTDFAVQVG